ncbi:hypothetical protein Tco_0661116 [Tanacetum coccineum]
MSSQTNTSQPQPTTTASLRLTPATSRPPRTTTTSQLQPQPTTATTLPRTPTTCPPPPPTTTTTSPSTPTTISYHSTTKNKNHDAEYNLNINKVQELVSMWTKSPYEKKEPKKKGLILGSLLTPCHNPLDLGDQRGSKHKDLEAVLNRAAKEGEAIMSRYQSEEI